MKFQKIANWSQWTDYISKICKKLVFPQQKSKKSYRSDIEGLFTEAVQNENVLMHRTVIILYERKNRKSEKVKLVR